MLAASSAARIRDQTLDIRRQRAHAGDILVVRQSSFEALSHFTPNRSLDRKSATGNTEQQTVLGWGKSVVKNLSEDIQKEFPGIKGFGVSDMWDMARFYAEYQSNEILQPLVAEISWSKHIVILTKCKETQQRQFYIVVRQTSFEALSHCFFDA